MPLFLSARRLPIQVQKFSPASRRRSVLSIRIVPLLYANLQVAWAKANRASEEFARCRACRQLLS